MTSPLHNLPLQLTSFIGREQELLDVDHLLRRHRLVTLTGAGGTGKTRLAIETAFRALDTYPDGIWFVNLAPVTDPALVPQMVASALSVHEDPNRPLLATLVAYLTTRHLLLILDNCEHLIDACAHVVEALLASCPAIQVLATSREVLGIAGEAPYRVPSLRVPAEHDALSLAHLQHYAAIHLFLDRATTLVPEFQLQPAELPALVQICRRLDGIPLAIELAAARIKALGVEQIAARLDNQFRLLTGGSRTALPRQQTLQALIDWSYQLLTEQERLLFRRLAVFAGGWTLDAAEQVAGGHGIDMFEVADGMESLTSKSLVIGTHAAGAVRSRMLEPIRQFALERLRESGESERIRRLHLDWVIQLVAVVAPQLERLEPVRADIERLEQELENVRAAFTWASEALPAEGARLALGMHWYWTRASRSFGQMVRWYERLSARLDSLPPELRLQVLTHAATLAFSAGDTALAERYARAAVPDIQQVGDTVISSWTYPIILLLTRTASDPADPAGAFDAELAEARHRGDLDRVRWLRYDQGAMAFVRGDLEQARICFEEVLEIGRRERKLDATPGALVWLGKVALAHGNPTLARTLLAESVALRQHSGWKAALSANLEVLAGIALAEGAPRKAAILLGCAAHQRLSQGNLPPLFEQPFIDQLWQSIQTQLEESRFRAAWAEGQELGLEQALTYALEPSPPEAKENEHE